MSTSLTTLDRQLPAPDSNTLQTFLTEEVSGRLAAALPRHMTAERLLRVAMSAMNRNPKIKKSTLASISDALLKCSEFGVEPNGWEAHLVPYKNTKLSKKAGYDVYEVSLIVDYRGYIKLAYQSDMVSAIQADVVREGDYFCYERGTTSFLKHTPGDDEARQMTHAWAVCNLKNGGAPFIVLNRRQVMEHKSRSMAAKFDKQNFWNNPLDEPAMWIKTAVRVLAKFIPQSQELQAAVLHENDVVYPAATPTADSSPAPTLDSVTERLEDDKTSHETPAEAMGTEPAKPFDATLDTIPLVVELDQAESREAVQRVVYHWMKGQSKEQCLVIERLGNTRADEIDQASGSQAVGKEKQQTAFEGSPQA